MVDVDPDSVVAHALDCQKKPIATESRSRASKNDQLFLAIEVLLLAIWGGSSIVEVMDMLLTFSMRGLLMDDLLKR